MVRWYGGWVGWLLSEMVVGWDGGWVECWLDGMVLGWDSERFN